jgi:hypothetical protein
MRLWGLFQESVMKLKPAGLLFLLVGVALSGATRLPADDTKKTEAKSAIEKELKKLEADWAVVFADPEVQRRADPKMQRSQPPFRYAQGCS